MNGDFGHGEAITIILASPVAENRLWAVPDQLTSRPARDPAEADRATVACA